MHWPRVVISVLVVLLVLGAAAFPGIYYYRKYQAAQKQLSRNPLLLEDSTQGIVDEIGKLIDLPKDETPTVATVSDAEKLKGQIFFAKAKNGDKVLIYNTNKKAILYDPVNKKILEVGPLIVPPPSPSPADSATQPGGKDSSPSATPRKGARTPTPSKVLKVVLSNGTTVSGSTATVEKELRDTNQNVQIVDKRNAKKRDYAKTTVIDLTGNLKDEATALAAAIQADVSSLPAEEEKPDQGDILIIVGEDAK